MLLSRWLNAVSVRCQRLAKRNRTAVRSITAECLEVRALLAVTITSGNDDMAPVTGSFASGAAINDSTPDFSLTTDAADTQMDAAFHTSAGALVPGYVVDDGPFTGSLFVFLGLPDGSYQLRVKADNLGTHDPSAGISSPDSTFDFTIDTVAPTANIVDVTPDPVTGANAGIVTINFDEDVTGVTISDFSLTRTTVADGTVVIDISLLPFLMVSASQYTIDLSSVTGDEGVYDLTLTASGSGIEDLAGNALVADATDNWVLPSSAATFANGVLTLTDTGTPTNSQYTVMIVGGDVVITDPNGLAAGAGATQVNNTTISIPLASLTGPVVIFGGDGDDSVNLDLSRGVLPDGIIFHGDDGNDSIEITNFDDLDAGLDGYTATYTSPSTGYVYLQSGGVVQSTLTYTGLEPLSIDGTPTDIVFNLPNGNDGDAMLADIGGPDGIMELSGSTFETTTFSIGGATSLTINGRGGHDNITIDSLDAGFAGLLIVTGGTGDDTLTGHDGYSESLDGGAGADSLMGLDGDDTLTGGSGSDQLDGGLGTDTIAETTSGNLTLTNTHLIGNGTDVHTDMEQALLMGDFHGNRLNASAFTLGPATLDGGNGNDTLTGTAEADSLVGGGGTDLVTMTFSGTVMVLDMSLDVNGVIDDLDSIEAVSLTGGNDGDQVDASGFAGRATVIGGSGDDTFTAAGGGGMLNGNGGDDVLIGGPGNDSLYGGTGDDDMEGNDGHDVLRGHIGDDSLTGGTGNDRLYGEGGFDTLEGGDDNDTLDGGNLADTLSGDAGNDSMLGGPGADSMSGGDDNDYLNGNDGNDTIEGNAGNDTLHGGAGNDRQLGGTGNDQLNSNNGNDTLAGQQGYDTLIGAGGRDVMSGGSGNDFLNGNGGNDTLLGDTGADTILGGAGIDSIIGGYGDDQDYINGQGGRDRISADPYDKIIDSRDIVAAFEFDFDALLV